MQNYEEALQFLNSQLPIFSRIGKSAFKKGLENITLLCNALGNPQNKFPSVHIAGTNGKGSTSHLLSAAFQQNGYKTGLYTSPHLIDLRERIRINGQPISKSFVVQFLEKNKALIQQIEPSYFELNVAMAFLAFAEENVDFAIIETGLGGRLDSTNIINPVLSIITNIGLDHTDLLGDTLEKIAFEKAGIIKEQKPIVIGEKQKETTALFVENAQMKNAELYFAEDFWTLISKENDAQFQHFEATNLKNNTTYDLKTDLLGSFQKHNITTVLAATQILNTLNWLLPLDTVLRSFEHVKKTTGLAGRWDWISTKPNIILDVAHNAAGIQYLIENLKLSKLNPDGKLHIILGFVKDKDIDAALQLFPNKANYYFTEAQIPRALPADDLKEKAAAFELKGWSYPTVAFALENAKNNLKEEDTLLITGSFFIVGEALALLK